MTTRDITHNSVSTSSTNLARNAAIAFASGAFGGLINSLTVWILGYWGSRHYSVSKLPPALAPTWLYPRIVWGGLWGFLFLLPLAHLIRKPYLRGLLYGLAPALAQLLLFFPLKDGKGLLGLGLGTLTPVFVILFNAVWGLSAAFWLHLANKDDNHSSSRNLFFRQLVGLSESTMALYLIESILIDLSPEQIQQNLDRVAESATAQNGELIEAQISENLDRLFVVIEAQNAELAQQIFASSRLATELLKEVRLVGQDLNIAKLRKGKANYLVEWNLPNGLTMEAYLKRKAEKSPLYAQVPEVKFERTYVCEDMSKCLCFYDSPDETTVKQAREVVSAPIDTLTSIRNLH